MAKRSSTQAPKIDALHLRDLADADGVGLAAHGSYEYSRYSGLDVSGRDLSGVNFSECELVGWSAHETNFRSARFLETRFERLNAPIFSAPRVAMRDVRIEGSRMGSVEMYDAEISSVVIAQSKLGWVNLRSSTLRDVVFRDCTIDELDFGDADLGRVAFENCKAEKIDLNGARLQHVDLRGLDVQGIAGVQGLKGATISSSQGAALVDVFANHFGIKVED